MDRETAEHFYNWLETYVAEDEQHEVEERIHALLRDDPELLDGRSWPQLRTLAEGSSRYADTSLDHMTIEPKKEGE